MAAVFLLPCTRLAAHSSDFLVRGAHVEDRRSRNSDEGSVAQLIHVEAVSPCRNCPSPGRPNWQRRGRSIMVTAKPLESTWAVLAMIHLFSLPCLWSVVHTFQTPCAVDEGRNTAEDRAAVAPTVTADVVITAYALLARRPERRSGRGRRSRCPRQAGDCRVRVAMPRAAPFPPHLSASDCPSTTHA